MGTARPKYDSVSHNSVEKRIIKHYQCRMRHICLDGSKDATSSAHVLISKPA